ncbi:RNA recognition motif domain-containing protein [Ditylenchus destructor]|uniref:RNA recognition motif domain-containing protein n=1 Tax=Ditylenchus destructor TaxID=166010 RepID=A0AAD4QV92_9BILA|nr:RNA recognition motif domain-containing protein [Ditylenchus destructor]
MLDSRRTLRLIALFRPLRAHLDQISGHRRQARRDLNPETYYEDNKIPTVPRGNVRRKELTLFVGSLSPGTTKEMLREHFSKYGELTDCAVKYDYNTRQSRGFGFVAFASKEELENARRDRPHIIDDVEVTLNSKGQYLVVDSLPETADKDSVKKFFSKYGQVQDCKLKTNSMGTSTAYVTMSNEDEVSRALADRPHHIDGKMLNTHQKGERFTVFVGNLPKDVTDYQLYETFSKVGKLVHYQVMYDWKNNTQKPLGYAFVTFSKAEEVVLAIGQSFSIKGTLLTVEPRYGNNE